MVSFEELSKKYPTHNVPPYGTCIVVPGNEFDPDWEALLEDCSCHHTEFEGKPVTLVVQREVKPKAQAVSIEKHLVVWTKEEIERFIKLWNQDPDYDKILKSFPKRTRIALVQKATELKKAGIIENAYVVKAKLKKEEPLKPVPEITVHPVGSPVFRSDEYLWSEKEEKLVIELWNSKKTAAQIQNELAKANPNRSEARSITSVSAEIARLQARGLIKPRHVWKKENKKEPETPKETLDVSIEEVERLLFVRGVGYCVRLSENLCQKLGLKEKDFLIVQLEKGKGSIRLIPADIRPREA